MPSKTWSIMACNAPIIASFDTDSDLADVICDAGAGKCVEPGNEDVLAEAIKVAQSKSKSGSRKSMNLREYVRQNASKEICVERYLKAITEQCSK